VVLGAAFPNRVFQVVVVCREFGVGGFVLT